MTGILSDFDITRFDSGKITINAPEILTKELLERVGRPLVVSIDRSEELRLRMISSAIIAANLSKELLPSSKENDLVSLLQTIDTSPDGPVCKLSCGGYSMKIGDLLVVQLPKVESTSQAEDVITCLSFLFDEDTAARGWVLDFSSIEIPSSILLGYLIGFNRTLQKLDRSLSLLWLRRDGISPALMPAITQQFYLAKKGAFLMTKR